MTLRDDTLPHPKGTRTGIDAADADTGTPNDVGITNPGATTTGAAYGPGGAGAPLNRSPSRRPCSAKPRRRSASEAP